MTQFPKPVRSKGKRLFFWRSQLEAYKLALAGLPKKEFEGIDSLVPAAQTASELGFGRRTLGRRVVETEQAE